MIHILEEVVVHEVVLEGMLGSQIPVVVHKGSQVALVDTGATRSCINFDVYKQIRKSCTLQPVKVRVRGATGTSLDPIGIVKIPVEIGPKHFEQTFIVCKALQRSMILGLDFLQGYNITIKFTRTGAALLSANNECIMEIEVGQSPLPPVMISGTTEVPSRTLVVLETNVDVHKFGGNMYYDVVPHKHWVDTYPNLILLPMSYYTPRSGTQKVPVMLLNLGEEDEQLNRGDVIAFLQEISLEVCDIQTETVYRQRMDIHPEDLPAKEATKITRGEPKENKEKIKKGAPEELEVDRRFLVSPADIEVHRKVDLEDAIVSEEIKQAFLRICEQFDDIFSRNSGDIGKTTLVTMDIPTGDNPPLVQKPYTLPLKHADWVEQELETLENAGVIIRSISPWASPIVIVPKKSHPDEPPRRRMCVDYRALNALLPPVQKAYSKAKGVLSLVPLPKIDQIYARLIGSTIYSTLDLRSGYHHIALSDESQPKTAFVTPMGKFHFTKVPFGLAQAPAYFQRLIDEVLVGLPFSFGYLDDILIYSGDPERHLDHIQVVFGRLRMAQLKLKASKCNFLKKHIQYLGHLVSSEGIKPLEEKLQAMKDMPAPTNPKEVRQFLGLTGYYRKFVPRYSDIAKPLTNLTRKEEPFVWTEKCESSFQFLKQKLMESPILRYPDPNLKYILFTDASKYAWAGVLTQEYETEMEDGLKVYKHPITYVSGLFKGSQLNWAALTKEAYAIYMCYKKLSFYLQDGDVLVYSDHLPLQKFLEKNTLNSKVNNWGIEMESCKMKIEHIAGIKNTLADTLSRLVEINPDIQQPPEPYGQEFGYSVFEQLPNVQVNTIKVNLGGEEGEEYSWPTEEVEIMSLELPDQQIRELQAQDKFIQNILLQLEKGNLKVGEPYYTEDGILYRYILDFGKTFEAIVVPKALIQTVLKLAHDHLGHNGSTRTYTTIKRLYYWKGIKQTVEKYVKNCGVCRKRNVVVMKYQKLHFMVPQSPMEFLSLDTIGEFHPPSSKGHRYALTAICMLTGFTFCIPMKTKSAEDIVNAYTLNIFTKFGGSTKMLTDNGTEFKNELFEEVSTRLGVKYKPFAPPYHPQSNGRIEGFHRFLKSTIAKHISQRIEWDDLVNMACAAYNFLPNEHSGESPFFLMFGRDPIMPLNQLLKPRIRYMGDSQGLLSLEALQNVYQVAAKNIQLAREKWDKRSDKILKVPVTSGTRVMIKDHTAGPWDPKYIGDYRVVKSYATQVDLRPVVGGKIRKAHITDIKYVLPADQVISEIPDPSKFGRMATLTMNPNKIPDLNWNWGVMHKVKPTDTLTTNVQEIKLSTSIS